MPPVIERKDLRHFGSLTSNVRNKVEDLCGQQGTASGTGPPGPEGPKGATGATGATGPEGKSGSWENLTLGTGVSNGANGQTPKARTEGGKTSARIRGTVEVTIALVKGEPLFTLPASCHPPGVVFLTLRELTTSEWYDFEVTAAGEVLYDDVAVMALGEFALDDHTYNLT